MAALTKSTPVPKACEMLAHTNNSGIPYVTHAYDSTKFVMMRITDAHGKMTALFMSALCSSNINETSSSLGLECVVMSYHLNSI